MAGRLEEDEDPNHLDPTIRCIGANSRSAATANHNANLTVRVRPPQCGIPTSLPAMTPTTIQARLRCNPLVERRIVWHYDGSRRFRELLLHTSSAGIGGASDGFARWGGRTSAKLFISIRCSSLSSCDIEALELILGMGRLHLVLSWEAIVDNKLTNNYSTEL